MKKYLKYAVIAGAFSSAAFLGGCATSEYGYYNDYGYYDDYGYYGSPYTSSVVAVYSYPYYVDRPYYVYGGRYYYGGYYRDGYYYYRGKKFRGGKYHYTHVKKRPDRRIADKTRYYQNDDRYRSLDRTRDYRDRDQIPTYRTNGERKLFQNRSTNQIKEHSNIEQIHNDQDREPKSMFQNRTMSRATEYKTKQKTLFEQRRNNIANHTNENRYKEGHTFQHRMGTQNVEPREKETHSYRNYDEKDRTANPFGQR